MISDNVLRFAIPSDGELHTSTMEFLDSCGLAVDRPNRRQYTATIRSLPNVQILFQRASDIPHNIADGSADLGIVGHDRFSEETEPSDSSAIVIPDLGYGQAQLVTAVPTSWIDVNDMIDLADLDAEFRASNRTLRIATKYPKLVSQYLYEKGLRYFSLVQASGALEAAPIIGYADVIVDISSTGTTLRENHLKPIGDGVVFSSAACLVTNNVRIGIGKNGSDSLNSAVRLIVDNIRGYLSAKNVYIVTAHIYQDDLDIENDQNYDMLQRFGPLTFSSLRGEQGSIGMAITITANKMLLREVVQEFRNMNATAINVTEPKYLFESFSGSDEFPGSNIAGSDNIA